MARDLLSQIEGGRPKGTAVWALGGAGFVVRTGDEVVYLDPYLVVPSPDRPFHRDIPVPFPPDAVRKADVILSTHDHDDHCNGQTLRGIQGGTMAAFVGPRSAAKKAADAGCDPSRITTVSPGTRRSITPSIGLSVLESHDPYEESAVMYLLETPHGSILHSGDTSYFEGFRKVGERRRVDVALLNFGKQVPTPEKPYYMGPDSVAAAARDLRARIVVPMHWNLWTEAKDDPAKIDAPLRRESPDSRLLILNVGERLDL